jgi:F-type H+-transporting ATPase subunit b
VQPELVPAGLIDLDFSLVVQLGLFGLFALVARVWAFGPLLRLFQERRNRSLGALAQAEATVARALGLEESRNQELAAAASRQLLLTTTLREELANQAEEALRSQRETAAAALTQEKEDLAAQERALGDELDGAARELALGLASRLAGRS